ncbi:TauD/TfdA family dioxygenase [Nisaea sp.]|uniref:TauD/TfdA family dioxygenase n=1 Tax=Nisaea sp. TaxID=2024842 RepID=UPI0032652163
MITASLRAESGTVHVAWPEGLTADYPYLWLRDNCPSGFHPQTLEREFDLLSVPESIAPRSVEIVGDTLTISWTNDNHVSRFDTTWLKAHRPGTQRPDPAAIPAEPWRGDLTAASLPRITADDMLRSDSALLEWLAALKRTGIAIVTELADDQEAGLTAARRIGHLRETNFGLTFNVVSKPNPNNLAYTAQRLPLHTDLANQELPPGFQFLHCLANEAEGGGSLFADGYAIAEDLKAQDREAYDILATTKIPFRFHDRESDIRKHDTVIRLGAGGIVEEIRFNAHLADILDLPAVAMRDFYRAYRAFMALSRQERYIVSFALGSGEMIAFDNRRVLHGRDAFDPATGRRHLHGCYVDRGDLDSRIRVLSRT